MMDSLNFLFTSLSRILFPSFEQRPLRGTPLPRQIIKIFEQDAIAELLQQNKVTMEEAASSLSTDTPPSDEDNEEEEEEAPPPPREEKGKKNCCIS